MTDIMNRPNHFFNFGPFSGIFQSNNVWIFWKKKTEILIKITEFWANSNIELVPHFKDYIVASQALFYVGLM